MTWTKISLSSIPVRILLLQKERRQVLGYSLAVEYALTMSKALGLIPSTGRKRIASKHREKS
jgi:hypothetical protein